MSTVAGTKPGVGTPADRPRPSASWRDHAPGLLLVCVLGGLVTAFFLGLYLVKKYPMPLGYDTPRYLDQTQFVARRGLSGVPHLLPPPIKTLASRAGFPVIVLSLSSLFGTSAFKLAATVPVAAASAVALASGVLVSASLRRSAWDFALVAAVVGTSAVLIRLMGPEMYTDNLLAAAAFLAALACLPSVLRDGRGFAPAILLLGVGGLIHAPTFAEILLTLGLVAAVYGATSWRRWRREGTPLLATPSGRLAAVIAGSAAMTAAGIWGLLRTGPDTPKLTRYELSKKIRQDIPIYRLWLTLPIAAVGAAGLAVDGFHRNDEAPRTDPAGDRSGPRYLLALLVAWCAVAGGGLLWYLSGRLVPAHRFLAFLLPLPILVAVGLLAVARLVCARVGRPGGPAHAGRAAGVAVALVGVTGLALLGWRLWYVELPRDRGLEWMDQGKIQDAATAARYLDAARVPRSAPVVFVLDDRGPNPLSYVPEMMYMIRSVLPPDRVEHAYVYAGDPNDYLAGRPTQRNVPRTYNANVHRFWPTVRALLPHHPVALLLSSFNAAYTGFVREHPSQVVGPNVAVLSGPRPATPVTAPPIPTGPRGALQGGLLGVGTLVAITLIGLGWAVALLPRSLRPFEMLALSPAIGISALLLAGVATDAVGIRLAGWGGTFAVALSLVTGGVAAGLHARRRGRPFILAG